MRNLFDKTVIVARPSHENARAIVARPSIKTLRPAQASLWATLILLTGCTTPPEPTEDVAPLTITNLKTTLASTPQQRSTLEAESAQLNNDQTVLTGTTITAQLAALNAPTVTITAPHAEWHTDSEQLNATGTVTVSHEAGWLQATGATCDTHKQTIFLKGPVESTLRVS